MLPGDPALSPHTSREGASELTSVSVVGVCPSRDFTRVCGGHTYRLGEVHTFLPEDRGGAGPAQQGGVHVGDARGHAPTLGQTRKRPWRPWGKMAPSGLKAVVGESECVSRGAGARGARTLGLGRRGPGGRAGRRAPDPRGGGRDLGPAGRLRSPVPERNKVGRLDSGGSRGPGYGWP